MNLKIKIQADITVKVKLHYNIHRRELLGLYIQLTSSAKCIFSRILSVDPVGLCVEYKQGAHEKSQDQLHFDLGTFTEEDRSRNRISATP